MSTVAAAIQGAHFPSTIEDLAKGAIQVAPQFLNDAKAFIAALNTALQIIDSARRSRNQPVPETSQS